MDANRIWQAALGELQLELTRATFETWLRNSRLVACEDGVFVIGVANTYARDWLESRLRSVVARVLTRLTGRTASVRFVVWEGPQEGKGETCLAPALPLLAGNAVESSRRSTGEAYLARTDTLNPRYTFDSFVVGPGNRLAHAACMAVAERPSRAFNPLFVYGGVGLGKTHLLHAIGHVCRASGLQTLYVSAETFTNDLIEAIRHQATDAFRETYRTVDVLLVDDVQFIAGKESTQEEFFHTFNALHGNGAQIVISSDRPPRAMATLEERLRSRFEWGLIVDIQPPELETRVAILRRKAAELGIPVPDEICFLIAERFQSNIRELEGALNRVVAVATLTQQPLTPQLAAQALEDMVARARPQVTPESILQAVADFYNLSMEELTGTSRRQSVARPRQVACYLLRQEAGASLPQIGQWLGGRDHTTVLHACERIAALLEEDGALRREIQAIREQLYREPAVQGKTRIGNRTRGNANGR
jgi:chromosomal replication initiator protein